MRLRADSAALPPTLRAPPRRGAEVVAAKLALTGPPSVERDESPGDEPNRQHGKHPKGYHRIRTLNMPG